MADQFWIGLEQKNRGNNTDFYRYMRKLMTNVPG